MFELKQFDLIEFDDPDLVDMSMNKNYRNRLFIFYVNDYYKEYIKKYHSYPNRFTMACAGILLNGRIRTLTIHEILTRNIKLIRHNDEDDILDYLFGTKGGFGYEERIQDHN